MSRLDWDKANRVRAWREGERTAWSGRVPQAVTKASQKQLDYLAVLLAKNGRRAFTPDEAKAMTVAQASRMIENLKHD